jgi:hypothetical protein
MKVTYRVNGKEVTEEEFQELPSNLDGLLDGEPPMTVRDFRNPLTTHQLAVHPLQRQEAMDHAAYMGVPTEFKADGTPKFETKQQLRSYMKAYGFRRREKGEGVKRVDVDAKMKEYGIDPKTRKSIKPA